MISCVYCGGTHQRPADVKRCWSEHQSGAPAAPTASTAPPPPAPTLPARSAPDPARLVARLAAARRGPATLGRHVLVLPGSAPPSGWEGCPRLTVDAGAQAAPESLVRQLWRAEIAAASHVIEVDAGVSLEAPPAEVDRRPQHELGPGHTFWRDELHHLLTANAIDARNADNGRWALLDAAVALGARPVEGDEAGDVVLPDGSAAWLDGGPVRHADPIHGTPVVHRLQVANGRLVAPRPNLTSADLAPDQLAAVLHAGGSARIIAPAGSGKTRVLTERARHLLAVWQLPPEAVALVAFNKRAQEEMRARTTDQPRLHVRTLNSIALAIVNGTPPFAPQGAQWRTIDEPQVREILSKFVQAPRKLNVDPLAPWIDALSLVRLGLVDPDEVEARYGGDVDGLAGVWESYRQALKRQRCVDFDDQIRRAIHVLLTDPAARAAAQAACRVLLVDEFQDLTPAHMLLTRLLTAGGGSVFGVGDDDQTIYGYNGADPSWLIDFATWFPGAGDHPLEVNYRCPPDVVDVADRLLRHNRRRVAKTIRAGAPGEPDRPGWVVGDDRDPVAATVAAVAIALEAGSAASDIAVLTRVNATLTPVQLALAERGVAFTGGVGSDFLDRTSIRAAMAWLRLASGRKLAPADLNEALRRPSRALHPRVRDWVAEQSDVSALLRLADRITNDKDANRIRDFAGDIGRLQAIAAGGAGAPRLLDVLIDEIGLGGAVATLDANRQGMNRASQSDDLLALRQIARLHPDLDGFERWLSQALTTRRDPNGVVLATIHRVKGQEWPHVVVHLAADGQFPHRLADDVEEERRLFHVAITRARRQVTIVTGGDPSDFVAELTNEPPAVRPREEALAPARRQPPPAKPARQRPDHPLLGRDRVMAAVGLVLVDQGQEWTITDLEPAAAVAERKGAIRKFALGEKVETAGRQRGPLGPRPGDVDERSVVAFDLLRAYRDRVRDGKPAYTVFDDKTLAELATALPADHAELAAVKGIGPAKLEQYGDDVLETLADLRDA